MKIKFMQHGGLTLSSLSLLFLFATFFTFSPLPLYSNSVIVQSSYPFLSGDTLRNAADYIYDDRSGRFNPLLVEANDVIFVKGSMQKLTRFFKKIHPKINNPYRLVTSNSDEKMPGKFFKYLDDPKLIKWFAVNSEEVIHPKLVPIPLGIPNRHLAFGNMDAFLRASQHKENKERPHLLYMNFTPESFPAERTYVYNLFINKNFCLTSNRKPIEDYLLDIYHSKFVLSPRGIGLDCYRTWEAITLGAIPIVKTSDLDPIFKDLPVLIIKEWDEITEELLQKSYRDFQDRSFDEDKIYAPWWINLIRS